MRSRITWLVLASSSTMVVSFVVPLCLLVRTLAEDRAMAAADQEARNVAILVAGVERERQLADLVGVLNAGRSPATSVLTARGRQIGPGPAMATDPEVARARGGTAFHVISGGTGRVLLPVVGPDGTAVVRTTVDGHQLRQGVAAAWAGIIGLGVLLMTAAALIARALGRRFSEPLLEVAATAHRLREGHLEARAEVRGTAETRELAQALNGLAERTTELLTTERAAVGDLAHRLRTPVTALRLDSEAVTDPVLAERLQEHIAALQRTIDSIVREARRPVRSDLAARCDAAAVVRERVDYWQALAEEQRRPLDVRIDPGPLPVGLDTGDLTDLVDILVDNVFAHTPEGTGFAVTLGRTGPPPAGSGPVVVLSVADQGPGFGTRRPRRAGTTGLGLEIASRMATSIHGELTRGERPGGGALLELRLPLVEDHT